MTEPEIKTIQEWIEFAEFIDLNANTDGSQWNILLEEVKYELYFLEDLQSSGIMSIIIENKIKKRIKMLKKELKQRGILSE